MDVATGAVAVAAGLVQSFDQRARQRSTRRVGGAHDHRIAARLGDDGGLERGIGLALACRSGRAGIHQADHYRHDIGRDGVFQHNDFQITGIRYIERGNDARHALQVVGVVGNDQRVVARIDVDGVVRADQRAQHRHQVVGGFVVQAKDLCGNLVARAANRTGADAAPLQLGVSLGHHLGQTRGLHHGKALQPQGRQKLIVGSRFGDRLVGVQVHGAAHPRVHHHAAPCDHANGARHLGNLGIGKAQRHFLAGARCRLFLGINKARRSRQQQADNY